jgi:hypothetical protein
MASRITEDQRTQAFGMFDQGASTNEVAKKLFNKYWIPAKKLRNEYDAQASSSEIEPADGEAPDAWDVTLQVPVERMDQIMALQARLNAEA